MKKFLLMVVGCLLICVCAYRFCGFKIAKGVDVAGKMIYEKIHTFFVPQVVLRDKSAGELVYSELEGVVFPAFSEGRKDGYSVGTSGTKNDTSEIPKDNKTDTESEMLPGNLDVVVDNTLQNSESTTTETDTEATGTNVVTDTRKVIINRIKLQDFDFLRQNFYQVDNTTTIDSTILNVGNLLEKDMSLSDNKEGPQVLIYHTHSQEGYVGSAEGDAATSVVAIGDYLTELLTKQYGIRVLHHTGEYDVGDRDHAYSNALPAIEQVLKENPSIEVVIDLHRDGVPENLHLVTEVDGRPTAKIMFFNGLSRTTSQGELAYLANPYIENNLALSFQLQLMAEEYYPGLARKIYLKGYRYNQHICSKCLLVEVGAQTNTFEEAKNAMIPLADILTKVLKPQS